MLKWPTVDLHALRAHRQARTADAMRTLNVDHLLMTGFDNIRYVTDYRTQIIAEAFDWFAAIADASGESEIFVPWVDETLASPDPDLPGVTAIHPMPSWTPAIPHVHVRQPQHVTEERAIGLGIAAVDDRMRAVDHRLRYHRATASPIACGWSSCK